MSMHRSIGVQRHTCTDVHSAEAHTFSAGGRPGGAPQGYIHTGCGARGSEEWTCCCRGDQSSGLCSYLPCCPSWPLGPQGCGGGGASGAPSADLWQHTQGLHTKYPVCQAQGRRRHHRQRSQVGRSSSEMAQQGKALATRPGYRTSGPMTTWWRGRTFKLSSGFHIYCATRVPCAHP